MSKIMDAALDPSCIALFTPLGWHSPLRQGVIWPGSARNFAAEPATWEDFMAALQKMTSPDFEFEIEYDLKSVTTGQIWAGINANDASAAVFISGSTLYIRNFAHYPEAISYQVAAATGVHRVKITNYGNITQAFYDGNLVQTRTYAATPSIPTFSYVPKSNVNCTINYIRFTCGEIVWSYPSLSERLRLVTYTNVLIMPGYFGAANPALGWSIKTALPSGLTGTVLAKINGAVVTDPPQWNRTAATFTGASTDTLEWIAVFDETLSADRIAYLSN